MIPEEVEDLELPVFELEENRPSQLKNRTLGEMARDAQNSGSTDEPAVRRPRGLQVGVHFAYKGEGTRRCRVGKVLGVSELERSATLHRFGAVTDSRLRVLWKPLYADQEHEGGVAAGAGTHPVVQTVPWGDLILQVELNTGVLNSASSRKLNRAGWRVDAGAPQPDGSVEVATCAPEPASRAERVARLLEAPTVARSGPAPGSYEQWLQGGEVDFLEVFGVDGSLSSAMR